MISGYIDIVDYMHIYYPENKKLQFMESPRVAEPLGDALMRNILGVEPTRRGLGELNPCRAYGTGTSKNLLYDRKWPCTSGLV